jgi:large subunit ribosomal protein L29
MPIMRLKEINDMSDEQRSKKLAELRAELARMRTMVRAGGAVENPARIGELRKAIARILTIEHEQKLNIRVPEEKEKQAKRLAKTKEKAKAKEKPAGKKEKPKKTEEKEKK